MESEELEEESYCICLSNSRVDDLMVQCEKCHKWFHCSCINLQEYDVIDIDCYHCPACCRIYGPSTVKQKLNRHRNDPTEANAECKPIQAGTEAFVEELKCRKFPEALKTESAVLWKDGSTLANEVLEHAAFHKPILVPQKDGLGMTCPDSSFGLADVIAEIGADFSVDVINVHRQRSFEMKLGHFAILFAQAERPKIYNLISLEFSGSKLDGAVRLPFLAEELSWVSLHWPNDVAKKYKPEVSKFCLISMKDSYTDFHIDFGGTSVWYHILWGEKIFYLVEPTERNLQLFETWTQMPDQSEKFFGDLVEQCSCLRVTAGQTVFIPTGWIHAVLTPQDSLVFGGNFLHSLNVGLQLKVYEMETKLLTSEKYMFPNFELTNWFAAHCIAEQLAEAMEEGRFLRSYLVESARSMHRVLDGWMRRDKATNSDMLTDSWAYGDIIKPLAKQLKASEKYMEIQKKRKVSGAKQTQQQGRVKRPKKQRSHLVVKIAKKPKCCDPSEDVTLCVEESTVLSDLVPACELKASSVSCEPLGFGIDSLLKSDDEDDAKCWAMDTVVNAPSQDELSDTSEHEQKHVGFSLLELTNNNHSSPSTAARVSEHQVAGESPKTQCPEAVQQVTLRILPGGGSLTKKIRRVVAISAVKRDSEDVFLAELEQCPKDDEFIYPSLLDNDDDVKRAKAKRTKSTDTLFHAHSSSPKLLPVKTERPPRPKARKAGLDMALTATKLQREKKCNKKLPVLETKLGHATVNGDAGKTEDSVLPLTRLTIKYAAPARTVETSIDDERIVAQNNSKPKKDLTSISQAVRRLREMERKRAVWAKPRILSMRTATMAILDPAGDVVEEFPLDAIEGLKASTSTSPNEQFRNLICVTVAGDATRSVAKEIHLFECTEVPAKDMEHKMQAYLQAALANWRSASRESSQSSTQHPMDPRANGYYYGGAKPVTPSNARRERPALANAFMGPPTPSDASLDEDERFERDVKTMNNCLDEIEKFCTQIDPVVREVARSQSSIKLKSKKKQDEHFRMLSQRLPPERYFVDIYKKFKLSFNLLGHLRGLISQPAAEELVHHLFPPLFCVMAASSFAFGPLAEKILSPLLTIEGKKLLNDCLDHRERQIWQQLGPAWTSHESEWTHGEVPPYFPTFDSGFVPFDPATVNIRSRSISSRDGELAAQAEVRRRAAEEEAERAKVKYERKKEKLLNQALKLEDERLKLEEEREQFQEAKQRAEKEIKTKAEQAALSSDSAKQPAWPTTYPYPVPVPVPTPYGYSVPPSYGYFPPPTEPMPRIPVDPISPRQRNWLQHLIQQGLHVVKVTYALSGDNQQQLNVSKGEILQVIDRTGQWWECQNAHGQQGYVPSTILLEVSGGSRDDMLPMVPRARAPYSAPLPSIPSPRHAPVEPVPDYAPQYDGGHRDELSRRMERIEYDRKQAKESIPEPPGPPPPPLQQDASKPVENGTLSRGESKPTTPRGTNVVKEELQRTVRSWRQVPKLPPDEQPKENGATDGATTPSVTSSPTRKPIAQAAGDLFPKPKRENNEEEVLTDKSPADAVEEWLADKGFSIRTIKTLEGQTGAMLFALSKQHLAEFCGKEEGHRLYSLLLVQKNKSGYGTKSGAELKAILEVRKKDAETYPVISIPNGNSHDSDVTLAGPMPAQTGNYPAPAPRSLVHPAVTAEASTQL